MTMLVNPLTGRSYEHVCKSCGKKFVTGVVKKIYCTPSCGITCAHCGKSFETSHRDRGRPLNCSMACRKARALVECSCAICGKKWMQNRHGGLKATCSNKCRYDLHLKSMYRENGQHCNWKGGRIYGSGYVKILMRDHPNANNGYVLEHRLVMEKAIGRFLLDHEDVHHKNGVRDDNRLIKGHEMSGCPSTCCNLELWSYSHPRGQRAQDKLEWARQIIGLYGILS
jgi:hypothetical protein